MRMSLTSGELTQYVLRQADTFFPDNNACGSEHIAWAFATALERAEHCFRHIRLPYFNQDGEPFFNHLNSDQYAMFLYLLSHTCWELLQDDAIAAKFMYLNKALHSVNCMYDTRLPEVFAFIHIVGSVIGKAEYGNFLTVYQGVTVGSHKGRSPVIGRCVSLLPHSAVVGACAIGDGVSVGLGTRLYEIDVPDGHIAVTSSDGLMIKRAKSLYSMAVFDLPSEMTQHAPGI